MKRAAVLYKTRTSLVDAIAARLDNIAYTDFFSDLNFNPKEYDLIISANFDEETNFRTLKSHLSLLPAFNCKEPIKEAFLAGCKITGITIYYTNPSRIVAQYPIFIYNDAHYDELKQELIYLEQAFFPLVAEKIIKNEPFESRTLMGINKCGGCNGCSQNRDFNFDK